MKAIYPPVDHDWRLFDAFVESCASPRPTEEDNTCSALTPPSTNTPTAPPDIDGPLTLSTPSLSRRDQSPWLWDGDHRLPSPHHDEGVGDAHLGVYLSSPSVEGGARARSPTTARSNLPTGHAPTFGFSMRPDEHHNTRLKVVALSASSEDGTATALKNTNNRSNETFQQEDDLLEVSTGRSLSLANPRPVELQPTQGCSAKRGRGAEKGEGKEEEEEEEEDTTRRSKKRRVTGTNRKRSKADLQHPPPRQAQTPVHARRFCCPFEDCPKSMGRGPDWTKHILHTHFAEGDFWACACGRCYVSQSKRDEHRRRCENALGFTDDWISWDADIARIHNTRGASLSEERKVDVWEMLGIAGVVLSVQARKPLLCLSKRDYQKRKATLPAAQRKELERQGRIQVEADVLYARVESLRAIGTP
ncbi:hypothetical protein OF83DRAFT_286830 [Amylostereum chailletii]|nr:hypothetical protein OF83DRAFT_286830 [Amylostereum chailletii]